MPNHNIGEQVEEIREVVISPSSSITPEDLCGKILLKFPNIIIKETCYGCVIQCDATIIPQLVHFVRESDPGNIFIRKRGYRPGDPRVCRNFLKGGQRPGFHFMEFEYKLLPLISEGLKAKCQPDSKSLQNPFPVKATKVQPRVIQEIMDRIFKTE